MRNSIILLAATASILIAGCDRKAEGQTIAVVNGEEITAPELNAELQRINLPEGVDKKAVTSRLLEGLIDRKLVVQQAKAEGIDKTPEFITQQRQATDALLISMYAAKKVKSSELPSPAEISSFEASRPEMFAKRELWDVQRMIYPTPTDKNILEQIKQTHSAEQLTAVLKANNISFQEDKTQVDTASIPHELYARIQSLPPGEPFLVPNGSRTIASSIVNRTPKPLSGEQAQPLAVEQMRRAQSVTKVTDQVKALRKTAKIEYKEGFAPPKK